MVAQHFKLREQPFGVTPDPKYLYASASHREALASLLYGLQSGLGFVSLIAKPGMGKTTLLFEVLNRLRDTRTTVFLFQTISTPVDLLRAILIDLGVKDVRESLVDLQTQLNRVLLNQCAARKPVVVVIDEAQNLSDPVLETVRMLSNFETSSQKLMQIVLAGQPQLAEKLMAPELLQLRQRISIFAHLTPLSTTETGAYILHRLQYAGSETGKSIFTPSAIGLIARHSEGIPRNINNLCFNSMSLAFALKRSKINAEIVNEVISDLSVKEHLLSAESSQFEHDENMPWALESENDLADFEDNLEEFEVSAPVEPYIDSLAELKALKIEPPLDDRSFPAANFHDEKQATQAAFIPEALSLHDRSRAAANVRREEEVATEQTLSKDEDSVSMAAEHLPRPQADSLEPRGKTRWLETELPDDVASVIDHPVPTLADSTSAALYQRNTTNSVAPLNKPGFASFESRTNWKSGLEKWNHTAIAAAVVAIGLCVWLGFVDYPLLFPDRTVQSSSKITPPVPISDSESADPSQLPHDSAPHNKGSVRVKRVESLATLCSSLYGECTPDLLEQLLVLNPSILYPNRLQPGQVISIPLDTRNAKTER